MNPQDRKRFADCFIDVAEVYGRPIGQPLVQIFWDALSRFDIEAVESAFQRHYRDPDHGQFSPKPADIIVGCWREVPTDAAMAAWTKLHGALRSIRYASWFAFDDPLIHAVTQDMGGIGEILKEDRARHFQMQEFCDRYKSYKHGAKVPDYPTALHSGSDWGDGRVVYVGDKTKIVAVVAGSTGYKPEFVARLIDELSGTDSATTKPAPALDGGEVTDLSRDELAGAAGLLADVGTHGERLDDPGEAGMNPALRTSRSVDAEAGDGSPPP